MKSFRNLIVVVLAMCAVTLFAAPTDNFVTEKVSVGVSATEIVSANYDRKGDVRLYNEGSDTVYIDSPVSDCTLDAYPLKPNSEIVIEDYQGSIFGIVETTTSTVKVMYLQY